MTIRNFCHLIYTSETVGFLENDTFLLCILKWSLVPSEAFVTLGFFFPKEFQGKKVIKVKKASKAVQRMSKGDACFPDVYRKYIMKGRRSAAKTC